MSLPKHQDEFFRIFLFHLTLLVDDITTLIIALLWLEEDIVDFRYRASGSVDLIIK